MTSPIVQAKARTRRTQGTDSSTGPRVSPEMARVGSYLGWARERRAGSWPIRVPFSGGSNASYLRASSG